VTGAWLGSRSTAGIARFARRSSLAGYSGVATNAVPIFLVPASSVLTAAGIDYQPENPGNLSAAEQAAVLKCASIVASIERQLVSANQQALNADVRRFPRRTGRIWRQFRERRAHLALPR
jgi:hypothetical protein